MTPTPQRSEQELQAAIGALFDRVPADATAPSLRADDVIALDRLLRTPQLRTAAKRAWNKSVNRGMRRLAAKRAGIALAADPSTEVQ